MDLESFKFLWEKTDPLTIASIWAIVWYQLRPIKKDIMNIQSDIKKIQVDLQDLDRRICRVEGVLSAKECCLLKDDAQLKKAE